jgi:hypothetical protein
MNKWAACHAVSPIAEIFLRAQSVLAPPDRQMYLGNLPSSGARYLPASSGAPPSQSVSPRVRARIQRLARAHAHTKVSTQRSLSPAPLRAPALDRSSRVRSPPSLCTGFHANPDGLMGAARSRHALLSAHKWACAATAGTCLSSALLPPAFQRPLHCGHNCLRAGAHPTLLCSGPGARSAVSRRLALRRALLSQPRTTRALTVSFRSAQVCSTSPARQADPLLVQGAHGVRHHGLKRHHPRRHRLRLGHAVQFRPPSPSSTAPPPPGPLSIPGGAPLLQGQGALPAPW